LVEVPASFLAGDPEVYMQLGRERRAVTPGWHFGSRFPSDPARAVVYDYLPDTLLGRVENLSDFLAVLAFDKWMGNADSRQAIFFRARVQDPLAVNPVRLGFVAQMVDNGYVFEGPHWRWGESPIQGLYFRPLVYRTVRGLAEFEPWLDRIRKFSGEGGAQGVKTNYSS